MCLIDKFVPDCAGFSINGIKEVGFLPFGNSYKVTLVGTKYVIETSTPFVRFYFNTQTGFFEENLVFTSNDKYLELSLKLDFRQLTYDNRDALTPLLDLEVLVYVVDNKDKKWILGVKQGMRVVKYNASTQTPKNNINGFELNWLGRGLGEVEVIELPNCDGDVVNGQCIAENEIILVSNRYGLSTGDNTGGAVDYEIEVNPADFDYTSAHVTKNGIEQTIPFNITTETVQSEFIYNIFGSDFKVTDYFLGNANPNYYRVGLGGTSVLDKATRTIDFQYSNRYFTTPVSPTIKMYITKPDTQTEVFELFDGTEPDGTIKHLIYKYKQLGIHKAVIEVYNNSVLSAYQTFYFITI